MGGTYTSHAEMRNAYKIMVQIDDKMIMITYSLTPWCRIFFEKLTVSQLVIYGTRRFIAMLTKACHRTLS